MSCHHCPNCDESLSDECDAQSEIAGDSLPTGYGLVAISFLLFFAPAALSLAGAWAFGQTAARQWLGGTGGFAVGMAAAVLIVRCLWNTDNAKQ